MAQAQPEALCLPAVSRGTSVLIGVCFLSSLTKHTQRILLLKFTHLFSSIYLTEDKCSHNWAIKGGVEMLLIVKGN